ncbi:hypothetical protein C5167_034175 [Papaver somniferum]|uniref:DUF4283 domain-containing protein n=1 Tax=Papaver somniferum TaxID=3469 RepID=A0A4Y7KC85_PAPSO|nr:hypothetical protein C5167_034175 [Papaver somniferum]
MASSSNTQVSIITKKMEAAKLKEKKTMPVRKAVGSSRAINVGAESWTKSLIGKIMSEDTTKTEFVKDEINLLWKKYRKREVRCVGRNLFIFNLASEKDMEEILKNSPWNVKKCLLSLKKYTPNIAYEDYTFTHQEWTVKFKNLLLEHQSPAMIDEALATLGRKISTDPENCRPRYGSMITARVEMELTKPLQRVDHNKDICETVSEELKAQQMTQEEFEEHYKDFMTNDEDENELTDGRIEETVAVGEAEDADCEMEVRRNKRIINPIGLAGGLCLLWKDGLELEVVNETPQIINCVLKIDARTDKILLSCFEFQLQISGLLGVYSFFKLVVAATAVVHSRFVTVHDLLYYLTD